VDQQMRPPARSDGYGPGQRSSAPRRRRRAWRVLAVVVAVLLVSGGVAGALTYHHLNGNITSAPLFAGTRGDAGKEKPDPFGRTPINILLIGSDSRASKANCTLGGDCGTGANADVEMVVHVSADRSNATVMSVPRDTVTDLPACTGAKGSHTSAGTGQINSTLAQGPGCTVAAVHALTGIPIDHFVLVDFSGVISMSDSVGGVPVCVDANVYDPYSHLRLSKGDHTLKGLSALEFVRSRHGFGDGSDLGRTYAQHAFLSSVVRTVTSAGTLTNPATLYSLADAATKALTVDPGLDGVSQLVGLAGDLHKVPTDRITFVTMQTEPDPTDPNRVVPAKAAGALFATITNDQSLTRVKTPTPGASPSAGSSPRPTASRPTTLTGEAAGTSVRVENASGVSGRATAVAAALRAAGAGPGTGPADASTTATSVLRYGPGQKAAAQQVAALLGLPTSALTQRTSSGLVLVIGADWTGTTTYGATTPKPVDTGTALAQAHSVTAATSGSCTEVSRVPTVTVNGQGMTPIEAFAATPDVALSAS
jgi:LCP family protein required for cell wall assembly